MRSIARVYASNLFAKLALAGAGLLLIRYMEVGQFALFTLAFSLVAFVAQPIIDLANRTYIVYPELGEPSERLGLIVIMQGLLVAGIGVVAFLFIPVGTGIAALIVAVILATICFETAKTFYQSVQRFDIYWRVECARAAMYLGGVVAIVLASTDIAATDVLAVQAGAGFIAGVGLLARHARCIEWSKLRRMLGQISVRQVLARYDLVGYVALQSLIGQLSVFVLEAISSVEQLATFGSAVRYYGFVVLALASLQTVLLPAVSRSSSPAELLGLLRQHRRIALLFMPAVAVCALASVWVIPWIDGGRYPAAVPTFFVLCASAVMSFSFGIYPIVAVNLRSFRLLLVASLLSFAICAVFNYLLVAKWGALGAAFATLATHAFFNLWIYFAIRPKVLCPA